VGLEQDRFDRRPYSVRSPKNAVLVLGMHRSGTSSIAGALVSLGGTAPLHLLPALPGNNDKGFWESRVLMDLNDEILAAGGSNWRDCRAFDVGRIDLDAMVALQARARAALEAEFGATGLPIIKDPRMCRLMRFWAPVFEEVEWSPRVVLPIRSPLEVAWSLHRRDGLSVSWACLLWLRHVLDAEAETRALPRAVLDWSQFLGDKRRALTRLAEQLELTWPNGGESAFADVDELVSPELRHHTASEADLRAHPAISDLILQTYSTLLELGDDPKNDLVLRRLDDLRARFETAATIFGQAMQELDGDLHGARLRAAERDAFATQNALERDALAAQLAVEQGVVARLTAERESLAALLAVEQDVVARLTAEREYLAAQHAVEKDAVTQLRQDHRALSAERGTLAIQLSAAKTEVDFVSGRILEANEQLARAEATIGHIDRRYAENFGASKRGLFRSWTQRSRRLTRLFGNSKDLEAVRNSAYFDERHYLATNPDVHKTGMDAARHYLAYGGREGRDPGPFFSTSAYLARYPDVAAASLNPLLHYEAHGRRENRGVLSYLDKGDSPPSDGRMTLTSPSPLPNDTVDLQSSSPTPWQPRDPSDAARVGSRRICIFSFYDPQGIVDDYVVFFLRKLGEFAGTILFYSNGALSRDSEIKLRGVVDDVVLRPNVGFDVMAYKEGLERIEYNREGLCDEVLMVNHTCYGPVFPFSELFEEMESRECDFWGVSAHAEMTPNPLTGVGTLPYHLNANFIAVRAGMLGSLSFRQYWDGIRVGPSYEDAILSHEARFTQHFTDLGYTASCYLNKRAYSTHYPAILELDQTLIDRNPLVKRRSFFHEPRYPEAYAADLPRALDVLSRTSDYDPELIWRNVIRATELRTLNTNAGLTSVLPDVRLKQNEPLYDYGAVAVCAHVYYTDMLDEIFSLTDTIPVLYDFIATTDTEIKKAAIEQAAASRKNIQNVIVRVVEENRGRDMSALFITCRDLFLDDRYGLVCRLHTKKTPHVARAQGDLFKHHMFENVLNSEGYTTNVLDMLHDKPWIGVAVPPVIQISFRTLGHAWYENRARAEELKKVLDLKIPFDPDTPVATYGTMFWFRPRALRKLFAHPWKWSEYNPEPDHVDGGLAHVQERLICYVAQDAGYTTQQIISSHLAGWNYAMMEYKLQKLCAALPNLGFINQTDILEAWRQAGYPGWVQVPGLPAEPPPPPPPPPPPSPSMTRSLRGLRLGIKRHLHEFEHDILRPLFHAVSLRSPRAS
jgi:lipopolysaccharide biosynthesis protein